MLSGRTALLLLCAFPPPALAGFDGTGELPPPTSGAVSDPVLLRSAASMARGTLAVSGLVEVASAPLLRATTTTAQAQIDDLVRVRLGGRYAVSDRVDIGLGLPAIAVWTSEVDLQKGGPSPGDIRAYARFGLTKPDRDPASPALGLAAEVRLPTGSSERYLGDGGPGAALHLLGSTGAGPLLLTANAGLDLRTFAPEGNVASGAGVLGGVALGVRPFDPLVVNAELRGHSRLASRGPDGAPSDYVPVARGAEALLTGRADVGPVQLTAGFGAGVVPGFAAARWRAVLGVGGRFGHLAEGAAEGERVRVDRTAPVDPIAPVPVVVQVQDEAGQPVEATVRVDEGVGVQVTSGSVRLSVPPGPHVVHVEGPGFGAQARELDLVPGAPAEAVRIILLPSVGDRSVFVDLHSPEDRPIDDARVSVDGRPVGESASGGGVLVGGLGEAPVTVSARAQAFRAAELSVVPTEGAESQDMLLAWERGAVQLRVTDGEDKPIPGVRARLFGADRLGPYDLGAQGERTFVLRPGPWQVLVNHPELGAQQRGVEIVERTTELTTVHFVLQPPEAGGADLDLRVVDPDNQPIAGARIALDGAPLGTTSTAGSLQLPDLSVGARTLTVSGDQLQPLSQDIHLDRGLQELLVVARYQPGATLFRARSPDGMAPDASVRLAGPSPRPQLPLGHDGVERAILDPGDWQVLFRSPSLGMSQQRTRIPDSGVLTVVDTVLGEPEAPGVTLALEVVDPDGGPVGGARVKLDGIDVGQTVQGGLLTVTDAGQGRHTVQVDHPPYAAKSQDLRLVGEEASARLALAWAPGAVRVRVTHDGQPVQDAVIRLGGPRFVKATPVGPDGTRLFALAPGDWRVLVSSPSLGLEQSRLTVPARAQLTELQVELAPTDATRSQTLVRVQGPDGAPVLGARVSLDDGPRVDAAGGYAAFDGVKPGKHTLAVEAPDFEPVRVVDATLRPGLAERVIPLARVPRMLELLVRGPTGDAVQSRIIAKGSSDREATTDRQGRATLTLDPGLWEIFVVSDGLRVAHESVDLTTARTEPLEVPLRPARVRVLGDRVEIDEQIYFATGRSDVGAESTDLLDEVADTLLAHPELVRVEIGGHTDSTGSVAVNMRLSAERARAVVSALTARGVAPERLHAEGYGPTRPQDSNDSAEGRAKNRRVEFVSETSGE